MDIDKPIVDAFDAAVEVLRGLGAAVEEVRCSFADEINPHRRAIADAEFFRVHGERHAGNPGGYGSRLQERIVNAEKTTLAMYIDALNRREAIKRMMTGMLRGYDCMLSPGYPCLAAPVDTVIATVNGKEMDFIGLGRNLVGLQNSIVFPRPSVPTGRDPILGLPMAIQITTLPGDEGGAFRIGHAYEQSTPALRGQRPKIN